MGICNYKKEKRDKFNIKRLLDNTEKVTEVKNLRGPDFRYVE